MDMDRDQDQARRIQRALDFIEANLAGRIDVRDASDRAALSPWHFQRLFHEVIGVPVKLYVRRRRLSLASVDLIHTRKRVIDIAIDAGFASQEAFTRAFVAQLGSPPSRFRSQRQSADLPDLQLPAATAYPQAAEEPRDKPVEVLHWWTSSGESRAVVELQCRVEARGYAWKDVAVASSAGQEAMDLLTARAVAGKRPTAAQLLGHRIQEWARAGMLADLDQLASAGHWNTLLPEPVRALMTYRDHYVAAPIAIHRVNCLWINRALFEQVGAKPPLTWPEFFAAAQTLRRAGVVPVTYGNRPWQLALLFQSVALGVGGADFYNAAFVRRDPLALDGPAMAASLAIFRRVAEYACPCGTGSDWDNATQQVIQGEAAMQFMADWARAEFRVAAKAPGRDYLCLPVPGTADAFAFHVDSLAMFRRYNAQPLRAQSELCHLIMDAEVQQAFSLHKGSIPARRDLAADRSFQGAQVHMGDFASSLRQQRVVPAWEMVFPRATRQALGNCLLRCWTAAVSIDDTLRVLAQAVKAPASASAAP